MVIYRSILLEKRIMFFGHDVPTWLLCRFVFSACLLVHPISGTFIFLLCDWIYLGILHERAFPYVNLGSFDFLSTPGYIIGVSNPFMKGKRPTRTISASVPSYCPSLLCGLTTFRKRKVWLLGCVMWYYNRRSYRLRYLEFVYKNVWRVIFEPKVRWRIPKSCK